MVALSQMSTISTLVGRNLKLFLKDKATVFFSLLSPIIVLVLYILFLGDLRVDAINSAIPEGMTIDKGLVSAFVDSWLIAGVVGVSMITIALNSLMVVVDDKQNRIYHDAVASPLKSSNITLSYFLSSYLITIVVSILMFFIGLIYLAIKGSFYMTFGDVIETIGIILLACMSSTLLMMILVSFIKTTSALSAIAGIISAVSGFVIGAYIPVDMFPKAVQYFTNILPASHATGLLRNSIMSGALDQMAITAPQEFIDGLAKSFSFDLNYFGFSAGRVTMYVVLAVAVPLLLMVLLLRFKLRRRDK